MARLNYIAVVLLLISIPSVIIAKIAGGAPASAGEFPFQVSLRNSGFGHICGGAIISPSLVVTAAACTDPRSPSIDEVVAGSLKRTENVTWQQVRSIERFVVHPGYNGTTLDNDLSLLFLSEPYEFNENISSIQLPSAYIETAPKPVVLSGWGSTQYGEPMFEDLMKVTLDTYTDSVCEEWVEQYVRPEILCSGADDGGRGGCQGDAGSPLITQGNNSYVAAVLSHFPCPRPDCCGIVGPNDQSTELSFYMEWILEQSRMYGGGL
ncbi:Trypsin-1 [Orchesella cincta]|uniref:Trypsin-1 n=1 Tax=Orchesella cincta TaxID=48709 RepID=A0A1D2NJW1_ORCCI|nr:Trypsin-1 [Orchesella cincta]